MKQVLYTAAMVLLGPAAGFAQDQCAARVAVFERSLKAGELAAIVRAVAPIREGFECPVKQREDAARLAALAHVAEAQRLAKSGVPAAQRLAILGAGTKFAKPWQLMASIGDVTQEIFLAGGVRNYAAASTAYQEAVAIIGDPLKTATPPPQAEIERLKRLANQTRALAGSFVPGGSILRDISVNVVPVPVQFIFKTANMNDLGRSYADETARILAELGRPKIKLVGHTDPIGGDEYNDGLSVQRAEAFKRHLVAAGYDARMVAVAGFGKRRPARIEDASRYSQDETHQMLRRVEVCFLDRPNTSENCR